MTGNELDLPKHLFLEAMDYNPTGKKPAPDPSQGNVARARRRSVAELRHLHDNLGKAITSLSVADSQGYMGYGVDVLQGVSNDMAKAIGKLGKAVANAEDRYDNALAAAAAPASSTQTTSPMVDSIINIKTVPTRSETLRIARAMEQGDPR